MTSAMNENSVVTGGGDRECGGRRVGYNLNREVSVGL